MVKFEVGKKYYAIENGKKEIHMEVLRRTKCYLIIENEHGEEQRVKIRVHENEEFIDSSTQLFYTPHLYAASEVVEEKPKMNTVEFKRLWALIKDKKYAEQLKIEPQEVYELDKLTPVQKWVKVHNAKLMKGDTIKITFLDGAVSIGKITGGRFGNYYKRNTQDYKQEMYLDYKKPNGGSEEDFANVEKITKIEVLSKSKYAKVPLFVDNKKLKNALIYWCGAADVI